MNRPTRIARGFLLATLFFVVIALVLWLGSGLLNGFVLGLATGCGIVSMVAAYAGRRTSSSSSAT